jgi:putative hydrolase of the HAD superfamily
LFDVYGTLFLSAGSEVEQSARGRGDAFAAALAAMGIVTELDGVAGVACLLDTIRMQREKMQRNGVEFPEIEITDVWQHTLASLSQRALLPREARLVDVKRLAIEYEVRANPVWPMPNLSETLKSLKGVGVLLGIVSNAQFYVHELFPAFLHKSVEASGFEPELQYYSYRYGHAKPGTALYQSAATALADRGIGPTDTLYVGNDMLNDIRPAATAGFRTALFAGDARSFRRRQGDPLVRGVVPDLIVTDLSAILGCIN